MGGKVFVMGGDFRQVLPVVRRGSPAQVVAVSLCRSPLWDNTRVLRLTANMRAAEDQGWSNWLLSIGEGRERPFPQTDCIRLPHSMVAPTRDVSDLLDAVYGDLTVPRPPAHFVDRAILTPRNDEVDHINDMVTSRIPGQVSRPLFHALTVCMLTPVLTTTSPAGSRVPVRRLCQTVRPGRYPSCGVFEHHLFCWPPSPSTDPQGWHAHHAATQHGT